MNHRAYASAPGGIPRGSVCPHSQGGNSVFCDNLHLLSVEVNSYEHSVGKPGRVRIIGKGSGEQSGESRGVKKEKESGNLEGRNLGRDLGETWTLESSVDLRRVVKSPL